jgi:hypothetical protein
MRTATVQQRRKWVDYQVGLRDLCVAYLCCLLLLLLPLLLVPNC